MKKNDWILLTSVLLYSFLFYQQSAGINFLIFSIALVFGLVFRDQTLVKNGSWKLAALGTLLSAGCLAYYGSSLALVANLISLSALSGLSFSARSSIVFSLIFSAYSYVTSIVFMYLDWIERKQKESNIAPNSAFKKVMLICIPILISLLFFQLYRASNPLFNEFAAKINFNFISLEWITFTLGGFILLYGFYYHKQVAEMAMFDEAGSLNLYAKPHETFSLLGKEIDLNDEHFSGKVLFLLLNVLLLLVNALDFNFIFINHQLPAGLTYSDFVHQGTGTLITSIIIAICIILFYFRGSLNFYKQSNTIKLLAYCWIIQNVMMLFSTAFRNELYIAAYGLTYKRIGVYVYLLLAFLGLATTFIKIMKLKSNHFLFRTNGWLFYTVLVVACLFNWDVMITWYNTHVPSQIEKTYLVKLSDKALPQLFAMESNSSMQKKQFVNETYSAIASDYYGQELPPPSSFEQELSRKLYYFMEDSKLASWQSWYYAQYTTMNDLKALDEKGMIKSLDLSSMHITSLAALYEFDRISTLRLNKNRIKISDLSYFPNLTTLELSNNNLRSLNGIHALPKLEYLDISQNQLVNYTPLLELKHLKTLVVSTGIKPEIIEQLNQKLPGIMIKVI